MGRRGHEFGRRAVLSLVVGLAACGGNVTVTRGFESRQVLSLRDATIQLFSVNDLVGEDSTLSYSTQPEGVPTPTRWALNLATGEVRDIGLDPPASSGVLPGTPRYVCGTNDLLPDGTMTVEITDTTTGVATDIKGVTSFGRCVADDGTFAAFRRDSATTRQVLWTGPYQRMAPVSLPFDVQQVVSFETDFARQLSTAYVLGASPAESTGSGLYTIDLPSAVVTEVIPATPGSTAWAAGAPQAGSLQSTSLTNDLIFQFGGHYVYTRKMSDGGTTLFAGPFSSGPASELALFQLSASGTPAVGATVNVNGPDDVAGPQPRPPLVGVQVTGANGAPSQLLVWDSATSQVTVCPSSRGAFQFGVVSPDGVHALFRPLQLSVVPTFSSLQLLTLDAGQPHTCVSLEDNSVLWADFSGDGSTIAWIDKTEVGDVTNLWTANGDGSDAKMILSGRLLGAGFIDGTSHLELSYDGDLVWLDVRDPSHFSYVAEQLFGQASSIGASWFVAGYNYSNQDASGLLGVLNLDSGQKLPISPAVSQYVVQGQAVRADGGAGFDRMWTGAYDVVYLVRGRNPSAQDGIWLATVRPADLP
ncbi:MAG: hypothetical protein ACJ8F1_14520 [Polyangia bacterium]